jgi:hypothetical protein
MGGSSTYSTFNRTGDHVSERSLNHGKKLIDVISKDRDGKTHIQFPVEVIPVDKYSSTGLVSDLLGTVINELFHDFIAIYLRYASTAGKHYVVDRGNCTRFA